jgi:ATP-dependent Lon protease
MTGEVTLRGRVMPIGGLREKTMAAFRSGMHTVIIPTENERDLSELDPVVREGFKFVLADRMESVLETAILFPQTVQESALLPDLKPAPVLPGAEITIEKVDLIRH